VLSAAILFGVPQGQQALGGPDQVAICVPDPNTPSGCLGEGGWETFTPTAAGIYCADICEEYDVDNDCLIPDRPRPDHRPLTRCVSRYFEVTSNGCTPAPPNYLPASRRLAEKNLTLCPSGNSLAAWTVNSVLTNDRYNLHEIVGRAAFVSDRQATPYPLPFAGVPLVKLAPPAQTCFTPSLSGPGVAFYGL
jgi:hypothetical protein